MGLTGITVDRNRLARAALAVVLSVATIRSLRKGKRVTGVAAGVCAALLGYSVVRGSPRSTRTFEIRPSRESGVLRCASCDQPIRLGQRRGPDVDGQIVHDACAEARAL